MSHALFATVSAYFLNSVAIAESVGVNRINWRSSSALVPALLVCMVLFQHVVVLVALSTAFPPLLLKFGGGRGGDEELRK